MARKVVVLFVQGARKESGADCQWCGLSSTPDVQVIRGHLLVEKNNLSITE